MLAFYYEWGDQFYLFYQLFANDVVKPETQLFT